MDMVSSTLLVQSEKIDQLMGAMLKAQQALKPVKKNLVNPFFHSKYAGLGAVLDALEPYEDNGIVITAIPWGLTANGGALNLITQFTHAESEQFIRSLTTMPIPKDDPQGVGSALSYARRYAATCMGNLAMDEDDDGTRAQHAMNTPKDAMPAVAPSRPPDSQQGHDASAPLYPFKPWKGKPLTMVPLKTLQSGLMFIQEGLNAPENAKYRERNERQILDIEAEISRREPNPTE